MATVAIVVAVASFAINLGIRAVAVGRFAVPAAALSLAGVFIASVMPVLGLAFGCYMAFRDPAPGSMRSFLLVSAAFLLVGSLIPMVLFATVHHHVGALAVSESEALIATVLVLPPLLRLVARAADIDAHAAGS